MSTRHPIYTAVLKESQATPKTKSHSVLLRHAKRLARERAMRLRLWAGTDRDEGVIGCVRRASSRRPRSAAALRRMRRSRSGLAVRRARDRSPTPNRPRPRWPTCRSAASAIRRSSPGDDRRAMWRHPGRRAWRRSGGAAALAPSHRADLACHHVLSIPERTRADKSGSVRGGTQRGMRDRSGERCVACAAVGFSRFRSRGREPERGARRDRCSSAGAGYCARFVRCSADPSSAGSRARVPDARRAARRSDRGHRRRSASGARTDSRIEVVASLRGPAVDDGANASASRARRLGRLGAARGRACSRAADAVIEGALLAAYRIDGFKTSRATVPRVEH